MNIPNKGRKYYRTITNSGKPVGVGYSAAEGYTAAERYPAAEGNSWKAGLWKEAGFFRYDYIAAKRIVRKTAFIRLLFMNWSSARIRL